jgi:drug/metabolite transporter (DMT)-like permease
LLAVLILGQPLTLLQILAIIVITASVLGEIVFSRPTPVAAKSAA